MNVDYLEILTQTGRVIPLKQTGRGCGSCQLCCTWLPIEELDKGHHQRCPHQSHTKRCKVYRTPIMPGSCLMWHCAWLVGEHTEDLPRPDRCGVIIDALLDLGRIQKPEEEPVHFLSLQIWVHPKRPDAWRIPSVEAYIRKCMDLGYGAMVRVTFIEAYSIFNRGGNLVLQRADLRPRAEFAWDAEIVKDGSWG